MTMGGLAPRLLSTVKTWLSGDRERFSVLTLFVPAMEPGLVQVVTSVLPCHLVMVSAGASIGFLLGTGLPVKSRRISLSLSLPLKVVALPTTSSSAVWVMVDVSFICDIMPMFLLLDTF